MAGIGKNASVTKPKDFLPAYAKRLNEIGEALYGSSWQSELGRTLSRWHPEKKVTAPAVVRTWSSGRRRIPFWVYEGLDFLLGESLMRQEEILRRLRDDPPWKSWSDEVTARNRAQT